MSPYVWKFLTSANAQRSYRDSELQVRVMESVLASLSYSLLQRVGRRVFLKWLQALPIFKDGFNRMRGVGDAVVGQAE